MRYVLPTRIHAQMERGCWTTEVYCYTTRRRYISCLFDHWFSVSVMTVAIACLGSLQKLSIQQSHPPGDQVALWGCWYQQSHPPGDQGALRGCWYQQPSVPRWNGAVAQPGMVIQCSLYFIAWICVRTMFKRTCGYLFLQGEPDYTSQNLMMAFLLCSTLLTQVFKKREWEFHPTHFLIHISKLVCYSYVVRL